MREDVPYPDGCDSAKLKCWKEWIEKVVEAKMSTLNGVSGDASGNVQIVGSSGVGVNTDSGNHEIQIDVSEANVKSASNAVDAEYAESTRGTGNLVTTDTEQTVTGKKAVTSLKTSSHATLGADDVACYGDLSDVAGPNNLVHRSGNETIGGSKTFTSGPKIDELNDRYQYYRLQNLHSRNELPSQITRSGLLVKDKNGSDLSCLQIYGMTDGTIKLQFYAYVLINGTLTYKAVDLIQFKPDGSVVFGW